MESEDYAFYQGLVYLMDNNVEHLGYDLTFSTEVNRYFISLVFLDIFATFLRLFMLYVN